MKKCFLFASMFFLLFCSTALSATYYVDYASGNDSNNGTSQSTPWKLVKGMTGVTGVAASASITAGDIIYFKKGVTWPGACLPWQPVSGASGRPVTYTATSWGTGSYPVFDGECKLKGSSYNGVIGNYDDNIVQYLVLDGLKFQNAYVGNQIASCIFARNWNYVTIQNCYLYNGGIKVIGHDNIIQYNYVDWAGCNPNTETETILLQYSATYNCIVRGNEIVNFTYTAIKMGGDDTPDENHNNIIEKNYIHDAYHNTAHPHGIIFRNSNHNIIRYNIVEMGPYGEDAITEWSTGGYNKVYNNTVIATNGFPGISLGGSARNGKPGQHDNYVCNNIVYGSGSRAGYDTHSEEYNATFDHNLYYNCAAPSLGGGSNNVWTNGYNNVDPGFTSTNFASKSDFGLQSSSVLYVTYHGVVYDSYQNGSNTDIMTTAVPQGTYVEIGAVEYQSGSGGGSTPTPPAPTNLRVTSQ